MIRKLLLSSVALATVSSSAFAADLPSNRTPVAPPPIPVFSWAGGYAGGQIGYEFGKDTITNTIPTNSIAPSGVIGGAHVGYNFQTNGFLVLGFEGEIDGSSYSGNYPGFNTVKSPLQGSIRARGGFAVDRALFFATGGAAFGWFKDTYPNTGDTLKPSKVGYTLGGGVEYALTNNWSIRGEYRYVYFSSKSDSLPNAGITVVHKDSEQLALAGFSYKFDWPVSPVVAKY